MLVISLSNILMTVINLLVLVVLMRIFLFKPVKEIIAQRQEEADREYKEASRLQAEADGLKTKYEKSLADAENQKKQILSEARKTADAESRRIIDNACQTAKEVKRDAEISAENKKAQIIKSAEKEIAGLALDAAVKVVGKSGGAETDSALYDEFLDKAGDNQ